MENLLLIIATTFLMRISKAAGARRYTIGNTGCSLHFDAGLTLGLLQKGAPGVRGMVEYWQDDDGMDWKVKGWTNGEYHTVLYVKNIGVAASEKGDAFLDGFRFGAIR